MRSLNESPSDARTSGNGEVAVSCFAGFTAGAGLDYRNAADARRGSIVKMIEFALLFSFGRKTL